MHTLMLRTYIHAYVFATYICICYIHMYMQRTYMMPIGAQFVGTNGSDLPSKVLHSRATKCFLKMGHSRPLFLYFCLFNTQLTVNKCSIYK